MQSNNITEWTSLEQQQREQKTMDNLLNVLNVLKCHPCFSYYVNIKWINDGPLDPLSINNSFVSCFRTPKCGVSSLKTLFSKKKCFQKNTIVKEFKVHLKLD